MEGRGLNKRGSLSLLALLDWVLIRMGRGQQIHSGCMLNKGGTKQGL